MNSNTKDTILKKWELLKSEEEYKTKYFSVEKRSYKLPNGTVVDDYYHLNRPNFVLVIAVNSNNEILVEESYRRGIDDFVIECPAGFIDKSENPNEAAIRELEEETGYTGIAELLGEICVQPGYIDQKAYVVKVTIDSDKIVIPKPEEDEVIKIEFMTFDKVNKLIIENKVKDMGFLSALALYDRFNKLKV